MPSSNDSPVKMRNAAKATYEAEVYRFKAAKMADINAGKLPSIRAEFDVLDTNKNGGKRRKSRIETEGEEKYSLTAQKRLHSINFLRDAERNFAPIRGMLKQFKINVLGPGVKLRLNLEDVALGKAIASWFNGIYSKNCDARDDMNLSELAGLTLTSYKREGDIGVWFDGDGKLVFFESDQFTEVTKSDWDKQLEWVEKIVVIEGGKTVEKTIPLKQEQGVVYDSYGRRKAYIVTAKRGVTSAKLSEVSIIPASEFRLIKSSYRHNQFRGVSELLPILADCLDLYEMRASEIQTAKKTAKTAGAITKTGAAADGFSASGTDVEGLLTTPVPSTGKSTYESYEALCGGFIEYLEPGEKFELYSNDRPNNGLNDFFSFVLTGAGSALGLAKTYSSLDCEKSYFAARGDMLLTWSMYYVEQKFLERHFFDWVGERAITFHAAKMGWKLPENWQSKLSWIFPAMPLLDEKKAADTNALNLDNLLVDYSELLGPDWKEKLDARKEQEAYIAGLGLARVNAVTGGGTAPLVDTENKDITQNE